MTSSFLGPESPRPLSVISESYRHRFVLPAVPTSDRYTFGPDYEDTMYKLVHKYLDIGTTDKLCYVGEAKGSFAEGIVNRFCVLEPMLTVIPGHYSYVETDSQKMLPIRIAHVGAEEYFRIQAKEKPENRIKFDKIIIKDAIRFFENPIEIYENMMKCLSKNGQLLIIHRPSILNTLPVFSDAKQRLNENEIPYMDIIKDLRSLDYDLQWEVECLPVIMPSRKWYSMLRSKFPPQLEIMSDFEMSSGVRELSEGVLKYRDEMVEFDDRLLFLAVTDPEQKTKGYPSVKRFGTGNETPLVQVNRGLTYSLELTEDLKKYLNVKKKTNSAENTKNRSSILC